MFQRWFSPRRRERPRSCSSDSSSLQQAQEEETEKVSPQAVQSNVRPFEGLGNGGKIDGDSGNYCKMDVNEDDEVPDYDDHVLDKKDACSGGAGDGGDDGDVSNHCAVGGSTDKNVASVKKDYVQQSENINCDVTDGEEGLKEQLAVVQTMVQELKEGFMTAIDQLSSIQDKGQSSWQDQQIFACTQSLASLKAEVSTLSSSVNQVVSVQKNLQARMAALQTGQQRLMEELVSAGLLSEKLREALSCCGEDHVGNISNCKFQQLTDVTHSKKIEGQDNKLNITVAACKSLSLTQALAARCQDLDAYDSSEEDVANTLQYGHNKNDSQSQPSGGKSSQAMAANSSKRRQTVQEIVDSEQEYCRQLWMVMNVYQLPLQEGHYMSSRQLCVLFPSSLTEMYEQHCQMLHSLQDRLVHWSFERVVGDVFARITDSSSNLLGLYQEYIESLPGSISCLRHQLMHSRSFKAFLKSQKESNSTTDLVSLLISPLQRIPKYMLQLQQVLHHTWENHPDRYNLQSSLAKLQDFVERFDQDITHTTHTIALDLQHLQGHGSSVWSSASGSSCEVLPVATRVMDNGIHFSGEDAAVLMHNGCVDHDGYLPKWLESNRGYYHTDPHHTKTVQQQRAKNHSLLSSYSQPDLTFTGCAISTAKGRQASVPQIHSQVVRSTDLADHSARQRRYKVKKRLQSQFADQTPLRPTSAIDFGESQQQTGRHQMVTRPHSVMGPFPGDGRNRVIQVHSQKPPKSGQYLNSSNISHHKPMQHVLHSSPKSHVINGQGVDGVYTRDHLVDFDDEDDTRALSDSHSNSSHKPSSHQSQDIHGTDTDNSDDYCQDNLAAALSRHLKGGSDSGVNCHLPASLQDLRICHHAHTHLQYPVQNGIDQTDSNREEADLTDKRTCSGSDCSHSSSQKHSQKRPDSLPTELNQDSNCLQSNKKEVSQPNGVSSAKHGLSLAQETPCFLSVADNNNSAEVESDYSPTEMGKEVEDTMSGVKIDKMAPLCPIQNQKKPHSVSGSSSQMFQVEVQLTGRNSITPSKSSGVGQHAVIRRAATPGSSSPDNAAHKESSKTDQQRKDSNMTSENLHHSVYDVSASSSKKKPLRTSLKNLFQRKKGSIILDELEREYTKELVRQCLIKNGHTGLNHMTIAVENSTNSMEICNGDGIGTEEIDSEVKKNPLGVNMNNCHFGNGFWSKIRKSPLAFLSKSPENCN